VKIETGNSVDSLTKNCYLCSDNLIIHSTKKKRSEP